MSRTSTSSSLHIKATPRNSAGDSKPNSILSSPNTNTSKNYSQNKKSAAKRSLTTTPPQLPTSNNTRPTRNLSRNNPTPKRTLRLPLNHRHLNHNHAVLHQLQNKLSPIRSPRASKQEIINHAERLFAHSSKHSKKLQLTSTPSNANYKTCNPFSRTSRPLKQLPTEKSSLQKNSILDTYNLDHESTAPSQSTTPHTSTTTHPSAPQRISPNPFIKRRVSKFEPTRTSRYHRDPTNHPNSSQPWEHKSASQPQRKLNNYKWQHPLAKHFTSSTSQKTMSAHLALRST